MNQHVAFLEAIAEAPASALDRLAYADWLDEQDDPLGDLLRVQAEWLRASGVALEEELARAERQYLVWCREDGEALAKELARWPEAASALRHHVLRPVSPAPEGFVCPACGDERHRRRDLSDPLVLGWALNPGAALSEVLMGERVPAVTFQCEGCAREFAQCPKCRAFLSDEQVPFTAGSNWGGYRCPHCWTPIPLLRSAVTAAVGMTARLVTGYGWLWGRKASGH